MAPEAFVNEPEGQISHADELVFEVKVPMKQPVHTVAPSAEENFPASQGMQLFVIEPAKIFKGHFSSLY